MILIRNPLPAFTMRLRSILPVFLLPLLSSPTQARDERVVSGYYTIGWEQQSFRVCGGGRGADKGVWWVSNPGPMMRAYGDLVEGDWGTIFVTVRMDRTDLGNWGHLGGYSRSVAVVELIDARRPSPERDDCSRIRETD